MIKVEHNITMDNSIWFIILINIFIGKYLKDMTNIMNLK